VTAEARRSKSSDATRRCTSHARPLWSPGCAGQQGNSTAPVPSRGLAGHAQTFACSRKTCGSAPASPAAYAERGGRRLWPFGAPGESGELGEPGEPVRGRQADRDRAAGLTCPSPGAASPPSWAPASPDTRCTAARRA
jgi:hypothetical protein